MAEKPKIRPLRASSPEDEPFRRSWDSGLESTAPMTVGDLRTLISRLPTDMIVVERRYSDVQLMEPGSWQVVKGIDKTDYIMRINERDEMTMSVSDRAKVQLYLLFAGN